MSRYSDANSFRVTNFLRSAFYALLILWLLWGWRWSPKPYQCFSGWRFYWGKQTVVDLQNLSITIPTVRKDCVLGAKDRYNPKLFKPYP